MKRRIGTINEMINEAVGNAVQEVKDMLNS